MFFSWPSRLSLLHRDTSGGVMVVVAGSIITLMLLLGAAVDTSRAYMLRSRISTAADAASLAAGALAYQGERNSNILKDEARRYYLANLPQNYNGAVIDEPIIKITQAGNNVVIDVQGDASLPTLFMRFGGFKSLGVGASAQATAGTSALELALVLDVTGSMQENNKIESLRVAARELINVIYGEQASLKDVYVSLVPYAATVNIGTQHKEWLTKGETLVKSTVSSPEDRFIQKDGDTWNELNNNTWFDLGYRDDIYGPDFVNYFTQITGLTKVRYNNMRPWQGCVLARTKANDLLDAPPSVEPFGSYHWTDIRYDEPSREQCYNPCVGPYQVPCNNGPREGTDPAPTCTACASYGPLVCETINQTEGWGFEDPNAACPASGVLPLTDMKKDIIDAINALEPIEKAGGTLSNQGMLWGWNTLSPKWRGLWKYASGTPIPTSLPSDYAGGARKVVIVMTDGINVISHFSLDNPHYTAYEYYNSLPYRLIPPPTDSDAAISEANSRFATICERMKEQGVIIFAVTFQLNESEFPDPSKLEVTKKLYRDCATSSSYYYDSPSGEQLKAAFGDIARQIKTLRLTQ